MQVVTIDRDWSGLTVHRGNPRAVLHFAIRNPPLGVLNQQVREDLGSLLLGLTATPSVRCAVFGSGERSFCAGADLREFSMRFDRDIARQHVRNAHRMILALVESDTPVIAAIRGACMGGGLELAMGCAYRIAGRSASFAMPEVRRGAWPGTGGVPLLARQVGVSQARRLVFTGRTLDADEALRLGVVDEVVEDGDVDARAAALAAEIAAQPHSSIATMARLLDHEFRLHFRRHLELEAECFVQAYQMPAAREGAAAFFEKRAPDWRQD